MKTLLATFLLAQVAICAALLFPGVAAARLPEPPPSRQHARSRLHHSNTAILRRTFLWAGQGSNLRPWD
jgi:hypothetical protein